MNEPISINCPNKRNIYQRSLYYISQITVIQIKLKHEKLDLLKDSMYRFIV